MSNKRIKEIANLSEEELRTKIRESERRIFDARLKLTTGQLENTALVWKERKDLARMQTILTTKTRPAAATAATGK